MAIIALLNDLLTCPKGNPKNAGMLPCDDYLMVSRIVCVFSTG